MSNDKIFKYLEISPVLTVEHKAEDFPSAAASVPKWS